MRPVALEVDPAVVLLLARRRDGNRDSAGIVRPEPRSRLEQRLVRLVGVVISSNVGASSPAARGGRL